ncbi:uncharacterized protein LOC111411163 [Olea europaea var. sylvestris]|uniref:uncharacterized protein LOC111411163 n=1 Tax=Olea europaea var. sylvestris TaxID=158386 RepID=UPI000C1CE1F0|nr:uncharacterized protein LOC111411163 [Olea europaea var. sylvestris]
MVATTLTVRVILHYGSIQLKYDAPLFKSPEKPVFNATLLKYASIDIGESQLKQEIEELLEGNFRRRGRQRSFLSSKKYNIDVRMKPARGISVQLRSPEFYRLWLTFRRYLSDWSRNRRFQLDALLELVNGVKVPLDKYNGNKVLGKKYIPPPPPPLLLNMSFLKFFVMLGMLAPTFISEQYFLHPLYDMIYEYL